MKCDNNVSNPNALPVRTCVWPCNKALRPGIVAVWLCAIRASQSLVRGKRSAGHESRLDRSSLRAEGPRLIGTALYNAPAALAAQKICKA